MKPHIDKNNLCMITTIYSLFEWLLYASEREAKKTFYIFENWIPDSITSHFENKFLLPRFEKRYQWDRRLCWIWFRYLKWRYLPDFKQYNLIAHDHLFYSSIFIGKNSYTLLEDGPHIFSQIGVDRWVKRQCLHDDQLLKLRMLLLGPTNGHPMGTNDQCTDLIVTSMDIAEKLKGKIIHYFDIFEAWNLATAEKRKFILEVFGVSDYLIKQIESRDIVFFSSAFCDNGTLTKDEYRDLYKRLLSKYDTKKVIIKPHPRDYCQDYKTDFPNVMVLPSFIPSQLLDIVGLHFKKAITFDSSAVFSMSYPIGIDWYGRRCHPKIIEKHGEGIVPKGNNVNLCTL